MRAPHRVAAPVVAAFLLVGAIGGPADANVRKFNDRRGDAPRSIDIRKVRVDNSTRHRNKVIVRIKQRRLRAGDSVSVYFDTKRKNRGPEFRITAHYASEYSMVRMKTWTKRDKGVTCGYRYRLRMYASGVSRATVHRKCLGKPGRVRVAVKTSRDGPGHDWARAKRRWLGRVKR